MSEPKGLFQTDSCEVEAGAVRRTVGYENGFRRTLVRSKLAASLYQFGGVSSFRRTLVRSKPVIGSQTFEGSKLFQTDSCEVEAG